MAFFCGLYANRKIDRTASRIRRNGFLGVLHDRSGMWLTRQMTEAG
jgi:hypothetical protein